MFTSARAARRGFALPFTAAVAVTVGLGLGPVGCRFVGGLRPPGGPEASDTGAATDRGEAERTTARTILLELVFVRCDEHDVELRDELWKFVDEQEFDAELRGRMAANGLRVGVAGAGSLPPPLAARLAAAVTVDAESLATEAAVSRRTIRLLPNRRGEVVMASGIRELVLLEHAAGGVRGGTYADASPLVSLRAKPAADGRVEIEAVPEIRHGPVEKSWVGEDGMFRLETGQRRHRLDHLAVTALLPREGMLILGCGGDDTASAGDCLLRDHDRGSRSSVRLLVIRPLADTVDPLFAPAAEDRIAADDPPLVVR